MKRSVFFISDSTGITVETLGHSILTQFQQIERDEITIPFINSTDRAEKVVSIINQASLEDGNKALVFSSLVDPKIREIVSRCDALFMDYFDSFNPLLKQELHAEPSKDMGKSHGLTDKESYETRIRAINFALKTDDGNGIKFYDEADIILLGVSRSGKTPTCLYMALQFGVRAANYPITEEDMNRHTLPDLLQPYQNKLFGLTIKPERLHEIRERRRPNSRYSSLEQCQFEISKIQEFYQNANIPFLNSTTFSIEEITTKIMQILGLRRHLF